MTDRRRWGWLLVGGAGLAAVAAAVALVVAWAEPLPRLDRSEARTFTEAAFTAAGFDEIDVRRRVRAGEYPDDDPAFDVWITTAELDGTPVKLWVDRDAPQAVRIDDNTDIGPLLSLRQLREVDAHGLHPGADDRQRRNLWITGAALLVVLLAGAGIVVGWRMAHPTPPNPNG